MAKSYDFPKNKHRLLLAAGESAWEALTPRRKFAKFEFEGRKYVARRTAIQLIVADSAGYDICFWYD